MVSILTRVFGTEHLELAEDVVQQTFLHAIHVWKLKGTPDNPSAWLFRVAKNKAIDSIRRNKYAVQFDFSDGEKQLLNSEYTMAPAMDNLWKEELIKDDLLKMMFACCHPGITEENQITLILKTLCGFSTSEIAKAFLTTEDTISKRLYRTKGFFRENKVELVIPPDNALKQRVRAVLNTVYLLFNEGYNSTQAEQLIREDLMEEAMMLCRILTENKYTRLPEAYALMALMCFHSARSESRITTEGEIILLPQQDRSKWDARLIALGNAYMNEAAFGEEVSPYHIEAAIAYEHCAAKSFEQTNWKRILELYEWLCQAAYSPIAALNKAVAVWQVYGPQQALESLNTLAPEKSIQSYYLYHCLLGELYKQLGHKDQAKQSFEKALQQTQSEPEKKMLRNKIVAIL